MPFWLKPRVDFHQKWLERLHQHFCHSVIPSTGRRAGCFNDIFTPTSYESVFEVSNCFDEVDVVHIF